MVKEINLEGSIVYTCEKCGWIYKNEIFAKKCEAWCKVNQTCNEYLIKHAIKF